MEPAFAPVTDKSCASTSGDLQANTSDKMDSGKVTIPKTGITNSGNALLGVWL